MEQVSLQSFGSWCQFWASVPGSGYVLSVCVCVCIHSFFLTGAPGFTWWTTLWSPSQVSLCSYCHILNSSFIKTQRSPATNRSLCVVWPKSCLQVKHLSCTATVWRACLITLDRNRSCLLIVCLSVSCPGQFTLNTLAALLYVHLGRD